jgi:phenylacetate-coenzyme A ligase PaaK-like adenylate-forming protein
MFDTALRQLRQGLAIATGRRIRPGDVAALVQHIRRTHAEFGRLDHDRVMEAMGRVTDPDVRAAADARHWRRSVTTAYRHTVYYRRLFDRLGIRPDELSLARRTELPLTTKATLRALPEAFVSDRSEPVLQAFTTGSTGTPTSCWFSAYELDLAAAYSAMYWLMTAGLGPADVLQVCVSSRAALAVSTTLRAIGMVGAGYVQTGVIDPAETLARLTTPVHLPGKKPRVSALTINPSQLAALVQEAERAGYRPHDFGLELIGCGGEVLSTALAERAERTFGARVQDTYGMTEAFPISGQNCSAGHLHFGAEQGLIEVLDPVTAEPTAPGAVGQLVVTPYPPFRETTLLLRYATGDLVRVLTETPSCEMAGQPATSPLLGKAEFSPTVRDLRLYQRDVLELLERQVAVPLPVRYQVAAAADGFDLHVLGPEDDPALVARLETHAAEHDLPIRKIVLHDDPAALARPQFVRALLRETVATRNEETGTWMLR